jgi:hypothetical protein
VKRAHAAAGLDTSQAARFRYAVPPVAMVAEVLRDSLPPEGATASEIFAVLGDHPTFGPLLNWTRDPSRRDAPRWHNSVSDALSTNPQLFVNTRTRRGGHRIYRLDAEAAAAEPARRPQQPPRGGQAAPAHMGRGDRSNN